MSKGAHNAGETSKSVTLSDLAGGSYTVTETASGSGKWTRAASQTVNLALPNCTSAVNFANTFAPAASRVKKVTVPAGEEAGWSFTLRGPGTPDGGEQVTTTGNGYVAFSTKLQEGNYTITETPKDGFERTATSGECSFTVNYPADAARMFSCSFTNTKQGRIIIDKVTMPSSDPQEFTFGLTGGPANLNVSFTLTDAATPFDSGFVKPGSYRVVETLPPGWDLTSATCNDGSPVNDISVDPGETVTCTFVNTKRPTGCTLTQGYWRTHSKYGPAPYDETWAKIGEDTPFFNSGQSYFNVLRTAPRGNAYYILAQQYIAAELNIARGADPSAVTTVMAFAKSYFNNYAPTSQLSATLRQQVLNAASTLDQYNNGYIGPGHCSVEGAASSALDDNARFAVWLPVVRAGR